MDVGGSMDVYAQMVEALFSAAHASSHFKAFEHFYFHNCIYSKVYTDMQMGKWIPTEELFRKFRKSFYVVMVGDACMNPYELFVPNGIINYWETEKEAGINWLKRVKDHYSASVWLNPEPEHFWNSHPTIQAISKIFKMYPLSLQGLSNSMKDLKRGKIHIPNITSYSTST